MTESMRLAMGESSPVKTRLSLTSHPNLQPVVLSA